MKHRFARHIALVTACMVIMAVVSSCSTKKNTLASRAYHNLTTHYNVYWNGRESFKTGRDILRQTVVDNYNLALPVYNFGDQNEAGQINTYMDRAIEKASAAIPKHSMIFRRVERNKWIDDCYMLMGKAQFYKQQYDDALHTFAYVQRQFAGEPAQLDATVWQIRALLRQKHYDDAYSRFEEMETQVNKLKRVPYYIQKEIPLVYAEYFLATQNYGNAKSYLKQGIDLSMDSKLKARLNYILGQIAQREKNYPEALEYFQKVAKSSAPFVMAFNARINMAKSFDVYSGGDVSDIEKQLRRMTKDTKNKEYLDQLYDALADLAIVDKDETKAVDYLRKAVAASVQNNYQKSASALQLADLLYKRQDYEFAGFYYDTALQTLPASHPDYIAISNRTQVLLNLAKNMQIVHDEDSLQKLANLPEAQLMALVQKKIKAATDEANRIFAEQQQQKSESQMLSALPNMRYEKIGSVTAQGGWYFYNPSALSMGYTDFLRRWGRRKLEDNWRLSNKRAITSFENDNITENGGAAATDTVASAEGNKIVVFTDPQKPETYLQYVPRTPEAKEASDKRVIRALQNIAYIFKDDLKNMPKSVETFQELVKRYPSQKNIERIYYQLYLIGKEMGDDAMAKTYSDIILSQFGDTDYARIIQDPDYNNSALAKKFRANSLYSETFNAFKNRQYRMVVLYSDQAIKEYNDRDLLPRFEYLRAMSKGKLAGIDTMLVALNGLVSRYPSHPVAELARETIRRYDKNQPEQKVEPQQNNVAAIADDQTIPAGNDTVVPNIYSVNLSTSHFYILMVDQNKVNVNAAQTRVADFIEKKYANEGLLLNVIQLDNTWQMITLSSFSSSVPAMALYNDIATDSYVLGPLKKGDYMHFIISMDNYPTFYRDKNGNGYVNFFRKNYPVTK